MNDYLCPHGKGYLNVNKHITLTIKTDDGQSGLLLLNPELGNYNSIYHNSLQVNSCDLVDIHCPICHENLKCDHGYQNLAKIIHVDSHQEEEVIFFSRAFGEQSTYKIVDGKLELFGKDSDNYLHEIRFLM